MENPVLQVLLAWVLSCDTLRGGVFILFVYLGRFYFLVLVCVLHIHLTETFVLIM